MQLCANKRTPRYVTYRCERRLYYRKRRLRTRQIYNKENKGRNYVKLTKGEQTQGGDSTQIKKQKRKAE